MKDMILGIVIASVVAFVWVATPVFAGEQVLTAKIDSVLVKKDKNGADFVSMLVTEQKEAAGVKYSKTIPVLAFRDQADVAKKMKAGDTLKAVVTHSQTPDGRESYRVLGFDATQAKKK